MDSTRVILTNKFAPGYIQPLNQFGSDFVPEKFTAFEGQRRLASGTPTDIALAVKGAERRTAGPIAIFSDATGRPVDLDLRGSPDEVLVRLAEASTNPAPHANPPAEPRGRGRPRLGVVAREVTLLPRHWEWLNAQPGGASVALRKLVEHARRADGDAEAQRAARDAAYHFMSAMAGNLAHFEEAARALFADDRQAFVGLVAAWPADIRDHVVKLAYAERGR
jgi:hypothetical protein